MAAPLYQCLLFGAPTPDQRKNFALSFSRAMAEFGLNTPEHFSVFDGINRDFKETVPTVAVFFGAETVAFPEHALFGLATLATSRLHQLPKNRKSRSGSSIVRNARSSPF
jgi:hypothetical protein